MEEPMICARCGVPQTGGFLLPPSYESLCEGCAKLKMLEDYEESERLADLVSRYAICRRCQLTMFTGGIPLKPGEDICAPCADAMAAFRQVAYRAIESHTDFLAARQLLKDCGYTGEIADPTEEG